MKLPCHLVLSEHNALQMVLAGTSGHIMNQLYAVVTDSTQAIFEPSPNLHFPVGSCHVVY